MGFPRESSNLLGDVYFLINAKCQIMLDFKTTLYYSDYFSKSLNRGGEAENIPHRILQHI